MDPATVGYADLTPNGSQFLADAANEKLQIMDEAQRRVERAALAQVLVGSLVGRSIPEWDTENSAREWVRAGRRARDERLQAIWGRHQLPP